MSSVIATREHAEPLPDRLVLSLIPSSLPLPADMSSLAGSIPPSALAAPTAVQNAPISQGFISPPGL
jgi:hypothetical protein